MRLVLHTERRRRRQQGRCQNRYVGCDAFCQCTHPFGSAGFLYVPSKKQCITITDQANSKGPYHPALRNCSGSTNNGDKAPAQTWALAEGNEGDEIYWVRPPVLSAPTNRYSPLRSNHRLGSPRSTANPFRERVACMVTRATRRTGLSPPPATRSSSLAATPMDAPSFSSKRPAAR